MKKILTIIGARPQFIKAAVVSRELKDSDNVEEVIMHTGQHFDHNMSEVFFNEMEIPKPKYHLNINSMSHGKMTGRMLEGIEDFMLEEKPDAVLVYGDTNSTLAGALVASKLHIPIGHVEAGLRSFNIRMPEEINRILTDRISKWLFCPTQTAIDNLEKEGYRNFETGIYMTGDVMYDAALFYSEKLKNRNNLITLPSERYILATIHRQENTHNVENLQKVVEILNWLNRKVQVIVPLHPGTAHKMMLNNIKPEFRIIEPVGYFDMILLLKNCAYVVTDSGGLQKEAYFFGKYCLTLREQTEWTELVSNGVNFICGTDIEKVKTYFETISTKDFNLTRQLYGDGHAGEEIVRLLTNSI